MQWTSFEAVISYMWGDHTISVPYKVRADHQIPIPYKVWGDHKCHWQVQGSHFPYKVWGDHKIIDIRYLLHIKYQGTISHWQLQGSHIQYKVWGTIRVIDSYKVPAVDSNHILHVGGMACPCPQGLGALNVIFTSCSTTSYSL